MKIVRHRIKTHFYGILLLIFTSIGVQAQLVNPINPDYKSFPKKEWENKFDAFEFKVFQTDGHTLPYRFYQPQSGTAGKKLPLVIFLHGAGERGFDNRTQFQRFAPILFWEKYPCFVLAPECPSKTPDSSNAESVWVDTPFGAASHQMNVNPTWPLKLVMQLIDKTIRDYPVDKNRIYITGLSMGGYATWEILQREGKRFAAAIPVCGGGDPAYASTIKPVNLWVFHGSDDRTVPVKRSRDMVAAVQAVGGNVTYTEYPGVGHDSWGRTYSNPEVWDWLFHQVKVGTANERRIVSKKGLDLAAYNFGSLGKLGPADQITRLKKAGYKGIILNSEKNDDLINLDIFFNELKNDKHFKVHAVMARYNFSDSLQKREKWKTLVDRIANRHTELWLIFGKKTEGITDSFIEMKLREIVDYAKTKSVPVILYPHSKCYIASAEEALPFVQKINDTNLKLAVHLCHEVRAGNGSRMEMVFEHVKKYIGAVTIAGTDSVADFSQALLMDKSTIKPIGQGNFNMKNFIEPLLKSDYKGTIGFINFKIDEEPEVYLKASMAAWEEMVKTK
ncbi:MAG TPA: hypothetical protein DHV48_20860 [Prolixibacteraceae bacterium]|nr:hypothetical protein [Prolixibacteraceae bacterium]